MKLEHVLLGFGLLLCVVGIGFLAVEYVGYLGEVGRLFVLLLTVGMFGFLGKYLESQGW